MSKIKLPAVTLLVAETRCHDLMARTLNHALQFIEPAEVVVCSDNFNALRIPGAHHVTIPDWPTKLHWERFIWTGAWVLVNTPFCLFMEWDAGVWNPAAWSADFMSADYIGAPWWYTDGKNVGNGGLSMRSKRLMDILRRNPERFQVREPGDDTLSRVYRPQLEQEFNCKWAKDSVAREFSYESGVLYLDQVPFGYHAMRNWVHVLDQQELVTRTKMAAKNRYIRSTSMLQQLYAAMPALREMAA
jgi:Protein of unknown function (DUF5672)